MPSCLEVIFPFLYLVMPFLKGLGPFSSLAEAEELARTLKAFKGWSPLQQQIFRAGIEQRTDGKWVSKFTPAARDEIFREIMQVNGLTRQLQIPTLFVKPQQGLNRSRWQLRPYQTQLANLCIREVPGNHWPFLVEHDAFTRTVVSFLAEQTVRPTDKPTYAQHREQTRTYFDGNGFSRWQAISKGHAQNHFQQKVINGRQALQDCLLEWLGPIRQQTTILDLGCGAGGLSEYLAMRGAVVRGIDISDKMIALAKELGSGQVEYKVSDLLSEQGHYDIVICLDVLIFYPSEELRGLLEHVLARATSKAYISFAPSTMLFSALKRVGQLFSGSLRTTDAYMHPLGEIKAMVQRLGYRVTRTHLVSNVIYNSQLLEIQPAINPANSL